MGPRAAAQFLLHIMAVQNQLHSGDLLYNKLIIQGSAGANEQSFGNNLAITTQQDQRKDNQVDRYTNKNTAGSVNCGQHDAK